MRTNIEIDDQLMAAAMEAGGFRTKREAVEEGLRLIARRNAYQKIIAARGTLRWDDSDEAWERYRAEVAANGGVEPGAPVPQHMVQENRALYKVTRLAPQDKEAAR